MDVFAGQWEDLCFLAVSAGLLALPASPAWAWQPVKLPEQQPGIRTNPSVLLRSKVTNAAGAGGLHTHCPSRAGSLAAAALCWRGSICSLTTVDSRALQCSSLEMITPKRTPCLRFTGAGKARRPFRPPDVCLERYFSTLQRDSAMLAVRGAAHREVV